MRNAGLERGGEMSLENLVFKVLRRTPFMDQLDSFKAKAYDKLMSVTEQEERGLTEADNIFLQGGILLIKGPKLENGIQYLYITATTNLLGLDRKKVDLSAGQMAKMAVLGNQVYRLGIVDGKLKALGVAWNSEASMLKNVGLSRLGVALNNNKTPMHWETLKFNNVAQAVSQLSGQILGIQGIKF
jgi:hypothetical protein